MVSHVNIATGTTSTPRDMGVAYLGAYGFNTPLCKRITLTKTLKPTNDVGK